MSRRSEHRKYSDGFRVVHRITRFAITAHWVHAPQQAHPIVLQTRAHGLAAMSDAHVSAWSSRSRRRRFSHHEWAFLSALSAIDDPLQRHFPPFRCCISHCDKSVSSRPEARSNATNTKTSAIPFSLNCAFDANAEQVRPETRREL